VCRGDRLTQLPQRGLKCVADRGRLAWQAAPGYGQRALIETTMGRYKALIGPRMRARGFAAQKAEATVGVAVLNLMLVWMAASM
jgi:hypothetical protein